MIEQLESRQLLTASPLAIGPETRVSSNTQDRQLGYGIAMDAAGDYVVTWSSREQNGTHSRVYAQRYDSGGVAQGAAFQVNPVTLDDSVTPAVAMNASGAFVIAWSVAPPPGTDSQIYAQRFDSAGIAQGTSFQVNTHTTGPHDFPSVAIDVAGNFAIGWQEGQYHNNSLDGDDSGVFARVYNSAGIAVGDQFQVNTYTTSSQRNVRLAMDAAGDLVMTWASYYQDGKNFGIYARRYDSTGVPQGAEFRVNTFTPRAQLSPAIAMDQAGDFVITWVSDQDGNGYGIYAQRYTAAGVVDGNEFRVNSYTTARQLEPTVAMDSSGGFVVAWTSFRQDGSLDGVFAQLYDSVGNVRGAEFSVNTYTTSSQAGPFAAMDASGEFALIWTSQGQDGNGGVYLQRYTSVIHHAPVGASGTVSAVQDTPYRFTSSDFGFTDPNDSPSDSLKAVKIALLPSSGTLKNNGAAVTVGQIVRISDVNSGKLIYTPKSNLTGGPYFLVKFQVQDTGGALKGSQDLDPVARTLYVKIAEINHAPAGTDGTVTGFSQVPYTFKVSDFGFTDPNDTPPDSLLSVKMTLLPTAGTLTNNGSLVTSGQFVSAAEINAGKLVFTPFTSTPVGLYFLAKFQVRDNGGSALGGVDLDPQPRVLKIRLNSTNHPPVGTSGTRSGQKNTPYVFQISDFGFTDPNDVPPNAFQAVKLDLLPNAGTITVNGIAVVSGQVVNTADISNGKLVFTPNSNLVGGPYLLCKFRVQDDGGGTNLDLTSRILYVKLV